MAVSKGEDLQRALDDERPARRPDSHSSDARYLVPSVIGHPWLFWLGAGLATRFILMPVTMHTDTVWLPWMANQIDQGHWNVYQYLFDVYGPKTLAPVVWAPYSPLYYYTVAMWTGLLHLLGIIHVGSWTFDTQRWYIPHLLTSLFLVKAIYLPFDLTAAWGLSSLVPASRRPLVLALWMLSPVVLVSVYMMGQNDIFPTTVVVLATVFGVRASESTSRQAQARLGNLAALLLGLAAGFKMYPLLLMIPFALVLGRGGRDVARLLAISFLPFLIVVAPFVSSGAFRTGVLLNQEAQGILAPVAGFGPAGVSPFVVGYVVLLGYLVHLRWEGWDKRPPLPVVALAVLGLLFASISWAFYWLVWIAPFVIWAAGTYATTTWHVVGLSAIFLIWTWNWGTKVSSGLFAPIFPAAANLPSFSEWLNPYYPWAQVRIIVQSALVGTLLSLLIVVLRRQQTPDEGLNARIVAGVNVALLCSWVALSFAPALGAR